MSCAVEWDYLSSNHSYDGKRSWVELPINILYSCASQRASSCKHWFVPRFTFPHLWDDYAIIEQAKGL